MDWLACDIFTTHRLSGVFPGVNSMYNWCIVYMILGGCHGCSMWLSIPGGGGIIIVKANDWQI